MVDSPVFYKSSVFAYRKSRILLSHVLQFTYNLEVGRVQSRLTWLKMPLKMMKVLRCLYYRSTTVKCVMSHATTP